MSKFRKKPVVVEAVQWRPEMKPTTYPNWLWNRLAANPELFDEATGVVKIRTLEGDMTAQPGDWIIQGIKGEVYPCKPDIFAATYEPVEESHTQP
jgi:hypothetical protein